MSASSRDEYLTLTALVNRILGDLNGTSLGVNLRQAAQDEVTSQRLSELKKGLLTALNNAGWGKKLQNAVFRYMQKHEPITHPLAPPEHMKEPITYIRRAQANWEKRILKSLNSMCTELAVPLARKRPEKEQRELASHWMEIGAEERDLSQIRPVYAPKDFLEVIAGLRNPNLINASDSLSYGAFWGIIQIPAEIKTVNELRLQYSEMAINQCQNGIDDLPEIPSEIFEQERTKLAKKVWSSGHCPSAREFSKKGCPISCRAQLWLQMLGLHIDDIDVLYYEQLKVSVFQHDLLVDSLFFKDVKLTATNDDQFFVFEDYLYQVLLPFSRDTAVMEHFTHSSATPGKSYIRGKLGVEECAVNYPPSGVIPFHGFSMYVAPMGYIYNDPITLYYVFREMYTRYFFRLHNLSSHPQGIVSLCLVFETLLQTYEPELFFHLRSIGAQPLKIAFKWLIRSFSGFLQSEQVLLLWDRILAYNSLEILPVLAASIFSFRKTNLQQVTTLSAAEAVLADISSLKVTPLIQLFLFSK